jgi:hypothetical protein
MEKEGFQSWHLQLHRSCLHSGMGGGQREPIICVACLHLLAHRPWTMWGTQLMGDLERSLLGMPSSGTVRMGRILFEFIKHSRTLDSLPLCVVRHLLRADESGSIPD